MSDAIRKVSEQLKALVAAVEDLEFDRNRLIMTASALQAERDDLAERLAKAQAGVASEPPVKPDSAVEPNIEIDARDLPASIRRGDTVRVKVANLTPADRVWASWAKAGTDGDPEYVRTPAVHVDVAAGVVEVGSNAVDYENAVLTLELPDLGAKTSQRIRVVSPIPTDAPAPETPVIPAVPSDPTRQPTVQELLAQLPPDYERIGSQTLVSGQSLRRKIIVMEPWAWSGLLCRSVRNVQLEDIVVVGRPWNGKSSGANPRNRLRGLPRLARQPFHNG